MLCGPDPKALVDEVTAAQLRAEVVAATAGWRDFAYERQERFEHGMSRWKQALLVLSFCRILHTIAAGEVTSKRQAGLWALGALDPRWRDLVQRALDDRPDPWGRVHQPADPAVIEETLAFVEYAVTAATGPQ